jgi:hypothetical protein
MVQKVLVETIDDIDGEVATNTVPFNLDGVSYEIDLSDENAGNLRDELARFIAAGRRTGGRKVRLATGQSGAASPGTDRERSRQIREWAQANGYEVSTRGRLSAEIVEAYEAAQSAPSVTEHEPVGEAPDKAPRKRGPRKKAAPKS